MANLDLSSNSIEVISALAGLTAVTDLDLYDNVIVLITSLQYLVNISELDLGGNAVVDIEPLVDNAGLATGDLVKLDSCPLSTLSENTYIPLLEGRGVYVSY